MKRFTILMLTLTGVQCALGITAPSTLLEMSHIYPMASLKKSVLLLVDYQNEYTSGRLPLWQIQETVQNSVALLQLARRKGVPVIHVIHDGGRGGLFDLTSKNGQIIEAVKPLEAEPVIKKTFPSAFAGTELFEALRKYPERNQLIVAGLMTHMCIASTVSSAIEHGYFTTIVASTTTTRGLKGPNGETIPAKIVKNSALAAVKDRFSLVLNIVEDLRD